MKYLTDYIRDSKTKAMEQYGAFFKYSNQQLEEKRVDGIVYCNMGVGLIAPVGNADALCKALNRVIVEGRKMDMKDNTRRKIIVRELMNHECYSTVHPSWGRYPYPFFRINPMMGLVRSNVMIYRFIGIALVIFSSTVFGHGGGLDKNGGHLDRKNGGYHCHRESCFSAQRNTDSALNEAVSENRQFSYVYHREDWRHWSDSDDDCMNTRNEILAVQSVRKVKLSPDGCYVSSGEWHDPYSGKTMTRASDLDIDHVVPLKWANDHSGGAWSSGEKEKFANDPLNLLAVDDNLNQEKGSKGPVEWMPPNHAYRCKYLMKWEEILEAYPSLKMTASENRTMGRMIAACKQ